MTRLLTRHNFKLEVKERRRLLDIPRIAALDQLGAAERDWQALFLERVATAMRTDNATLAAARIEATTIPKQLQKTHTRVLTAFMTLQVTNGKRLAKQRLAFYRPRAERMQRIREFVGVEEALQKRYARRAGIYAGWVNRKLLESASDITQSRLAQTVARAKTVITTSVNEGFTRTQARDALAKAFADYSVYELDRVITTESTRCINLGTFQEESQEAIVVGWSWQVNYVGCPICDAYQSDYAFMPKDGAIKMPPAHPNCECTLEPVFAFDPIGANYLAKRK